MEWAARPAVRPAGCLVEVCPAAACRVDLQEVRQEAHPAVLQAAVLQAAVHLAEALQVAALQVAECPVAECPAVHQAACRVAHPAAECQVVLLAA